MQESTELGNRKTGQTEIYNAFVAYAANWMQERLKQGQNPQEVAYLIAEILKEPQPKMRYQTSLKGKAAIASRFCDLTGEKSIEERRELIKQLWRGPLDEKIGSSY